MPRPLQIVPDEPPSPAAATLVAQGMHSNARLEAALGGCYAVERLLGRSAVASVFLAHDIPGRRSVTIKLVDTDLAYDVGGATYVRAIGDRRELGKAHVLPPGPGANDGGGLYYVSPYVPGRPLSEFLMKSPTIGWEEALRIASDSARALDHWHALGLAHGDMGPDTLLMLGDQILLAPPSRVVYGWEERRRDVQALARLCLALFERSRRPALPPGNWQRLHALLAGAAAGSAPPSFSAGDIAETLASAERGELGPGRLRRWLTTIARWIQRERR